MLNPTILITIRGPLETVDLEVPGDVPVSELIPILLEIFSAPTNNPQELWTSPVSLQVAGKHAPIPPNKTLIEANVCDGIALVLETKRPAKKDPELQRFVPITVQPGTSTSGIGVSWETLG